MTSIKPQENKYTPFVTTHYSFFDSIIQPDKLVKKLQEQELSSCVILEENNLSSCVSATKTLKQEKIKPILGCKFKTSLGEETFIAKNFQGWLNLVKIHNSMKDGVVDTSIIKNNSSNLICILGNEFSVFNNLNREGNTQRLVDSYISDFGRENLFFGVNSHTVTANQLREYSTTYNVKAIALNQTRYLNKDDYWLYKIMLGSRHNVTLNRLTNVQDVKTQSLLRDNTSFLSAFANTEEELHNSNLLADMCEAIDLTSKPKLPHFHTPTGESEIDWIRKYTHDILHDRKKDSWNIQEYEDRLKLELGVLEKAGLGGYFLIVMDYIKFAKNNGWLVGPSRGSAAGCLVSYFLDITQVNPIPHDLLFSRFYNDGRNTAERIAYPDIDVDFPVNHRESVVEYIRGKYGERHTAQMATFGALKGRGVLTEILRIGDVCDRFTISRITENIPEEHRISDKLEEDHETSIIRWTLDNEPKLLEEYCVKDDKGELTGDYAQYFKQAINLEGTYKSMGKHAAGVIITSADLYETCPTLDNKVLVDMDSAKDMGLIKFDILGLATLDKLMLVNDLLQGKK